MHSSVLEMPQTTSIFQRGNMKEEIPNWYKQPESRRPAPSHADFLRDHYEQPAFTPNYFRNELDTIRKDYVLASNDDSLIDPIKAVPVLSSLLREAVAPLRRAFGNQSFLQLEALQSDDDSVLRVIVKLPSQSINPGEKLRTFKSSWWFKNCSRSEASLIFDYEIGDDV